MSPWEWFWVMLVCVGSGWLGAEVSNRFETRRRRWDDNRHRRWAEGQLKEWDKRNEHERRQGKAAAAKTPVSGSAGSRKADPDDERPSPLEEIHPLLNPLSPLSHYYAAGAGIEDIGDVQRPDALVVERVPAGLDTVPGDPDGIRDRSPDFPGRGEAGAAAQTTAIESPKAFESSFSGGGTSETSVDASGGDTTCGSE